MAIPLLYGSAFVCVALALLKKPVTPDVADAVSLQIYLISIGPFCNFVVFIAPNDFR